LAFVSLLFVSKRLRRFTKRYLQTHFFYCSKITKFYFHIFHFNRYSSQQTYLQPIFKWWINSSVPIAKNYQELQTSSNRDYRANYLKFRKKWTLYSSFAETLALYAAHSGDIRFYRVSKSCYGCAFGFIAQRCFYGYYQFLKDHRYTDPRFPLILYKLQNFVEKQEGKTFLGLTFLDY
jgi:hypothetical protein